MCSVHAGPGLRNELLVCLQTAGFVGVNAQHTKPIYSAELVFVQSLLTAILL